jgi:hypothetical protein
MSGWLMVFALPAAEPRAEAELSSTQGSRLMLSAQRRQKGGRGECSVESMSSHRLHLGKTTSRGRPIRVHQHQAASSSASTQLNAAQHPSETRSSIIVILQHRTDWSEHTRQAKEIMSRSSKVDSKGQDLVRRHIESTRSGNQVRENEARQCRRRRRLQGTSGE